MAAPAAPPTHRVDLVPRPGLSDEDREALSAVAGALAMMHHTSGLEDWTARPAPEARVLGGAWEFVDLSEWRDSDAALRISFAKALDARRFHRAARAQLASNPLWQALLAEVRPPRVDRPRDWVKLWRKHYKPLRFTATRPESGPPAHPDLWVVPAWMKAPPAARDALTVRMYPGQAFGTGADPTTAMCLGHFLDTRAELAARAPTTRAPLQVLDFGAGTGILAIAAARWAEAAGLPLRATCVEIDRAARGQLDINRRQNGVSLRNLAAPPPRAGWAHLVFANVLAGILTAHRDALVDALAPGGLLVMSGVLRDEYADFLPRFRRGLRGARTLDVWAEREQAEWASVVLRRRG